MISSLRTLYKHFLPRQSDSQNRRSIRKRRHQNTHAAIEALEERRLLTAAAWEPIEITDEAAAFFDDSYVHEIRITFADADWYATLFDSHSTDVDDPYFEASFEADGIQLGSIGVRFKGNSSFAGTGIKKSIKLDFNEYEQAGEDLSFLGLTKLNLNNNYNDPTMLREKLFYDYASNFVEGISRAVHTRVFINDEYYGLYTAVEQIDKNLVQSRFGSDEDGNLYKGSASDDVADDPQADFGSDLTYLGTDQADYEDFYQLKTNETANDYSQLIELLDVLNNTASTELSDAIEPLLDVEDTLASLALNNLFVNLDSYSGAAHNFYLYDRDDTGQFTHVFWDVNESFGSFTQFTERGSDPVELDPFWLPTAMGPPGQVEPELRPLAENLWAVEEYSTEYLRDLSEMLREGFDVTSATTRINELADLIRTDVTDDPNKQFTTAQFEQNLTTNVNDGMRTLYGLTSFIEDRSTFLLSALDEFAEQSDLAINELMSVNVTTIQDEAGDFDPWIEIYNNGPGTVALAGTYLTDDASDPTKWAIPAEDLNDADYLTLWVDGETNEGTSHTSFTLDPAGGQLFLTDGTSVIDTISFGAFGSLGDDTSQARVPDGVGEFETTDQPTFAAENLATTVIVQPVEIFINEVMADNEATIEDPDDAGAFDDWIELYNAGTTTVDLSGFYLTDDTADATQWQFPSGSTIDAGAYLVIWADDDTDQGDNHASFKLSAGGESVALYNIDGATLVDSVTFGEQTTDVSYGRYLDGTDNFISMASPTPGEANVVLVQTVDIVINEIMADNDAAIEDPDEAGAFEDWIELYNTGTTTVDLSGFYLTDDTADATQWQFPSGSTIDAGAYLIIWADDDTDQGVSHASFKLSGGGETVALYNIDGATVVDSVTFGEQITDVSYGRYLDGTDNFISMTAPTPGEANVDNPGALTVVITADSISESDGIAATTATVTRSGDTTDELTVTLSSDDTGEATAPLSVQIPAGQTSVTFDIAAVDDTLVDGSQTVTITATAANHNDGSDTIEVTDDDDATQVVRYDADGSGTTDTLTDGILILRYLAGFTGDALTANAVDPAGTRTDPDSIGTYLADLSAAGWFDVDGNQQTLALTDGVLILRYFAGFTGGPLVSNAVDLQNGTRTLAEPIIEFLNDTPLAASGPIASQAFAAAGALPDADGFESKYGPESKSQDSPMVYHRLDEVFFDDEESDLEFGL